MGRIHAKVEMSNGVETRGKIKVWKLRNRLSFLALVVLFTIFGGGRGSQWCFVIHDNADWLYEVNLVTVRNHEPDVLEFQVRATRGEDVAYDSWILDAGDNTLLLESQGKLEKIRPGSVAAHFIRYFRLQGRLPISGVPAHVRGPH